MVLISQGKTGQDRTGDGDGEDGRQAGEGGKWQGRTGQGSNSARTLEHPASASPGQSDKVRLDRLREYGRTVGMHCIQYSRFCV